MVRLCVYHVPSIPVSYGSRVLIPTASHLRFSVDHSRRSPSISHVFELSYGPVLPPVHPHLRSRVVVVVK